MIPELKRLQKKYSTWWTFKIDSPLPEYLKQHHVSLGQYFCPEELFNAIYSVANSNWMFEPGNSSIIVPDSALQKCFKTWIIYTPDLFKHCTEHVTSAPTDKRDELLRGAIADHFFVETPTEIVFKDPSSLFWLHPEINCIMNKNQTIVYSWETLNTLFLDFCTTNTNHFTRLNDSIISINPLSDLGTIFKFKFFDKNQISTILKSITRFLGKTNTLEHCCKHLKFTNVSPHVFTFIDLSMNNYNSFLPHIPSYNNVHI